MRPVLSIIFTSACLVFSSAPATETLDPLEQEPGASVKAPPDGKKAHVVSGRIVDGLGRPLPRVIVEVMSPEPAQEEPIEVMLSGEDGRFSRPIGEEFKKVRLNFKKTNHVYFSAKATVSEPAEYTMRRTIDWEKLADLRWSEGEELDQGMREFLGSADGSESKVEGFQARESHKDELLRYVFRYHGPFRPAMRRLTKDPQVGRAARIWLDVLGYPDDRDLIPEGRRFSPKHEIGEEDLVEAIKAISSRLNFFSDAPEPEIDVSSITFTPKMDRALIECSINSTVFWHFVFHKEGKRWVLRSMQEVGRA